MEHISYEMSLDIGSLVIKTPIIEIGNENGPTLGISCCIHGNETSSLFIIEKLVSKIKMLSLYGKVKVVVISNPIATLFKNRFSPLDFQDMNRIAPGNNRGTVSERVCRMALEQLVTCDYYIDLHEFNIDSLIQGIYMENEQPEIALKSKKLLECFGPEIMVLLGRSIYNNSIYGYLNKKKNIPGFVVEIPNNSLLTPEREERVVNSFIDVLDYLEIVKPSGRSENKSNMINISGSYSYISEFQGLFFRNQQVGNGVKQNEEVGYILEVDFKTKHIIYNTGPDGYLIHLAPKSLVNVGELIFTIGSNENK